MPSTGNLTIRTSTADQAFPVPGAQVTIYAESDLNTVLDTSVTDSSGQSKVFSLPAPPQEYSNSPNDPAAFTTYRVRVSHPSYSTTQVEGVSIFPGIASTLPVYLIPRIGGADQSQNLLVTTGPTGSGTDDGTGGTNG